MPARLLTLIALVSGLVMLTPAFAGNKVAFIGDQGVGSNARAVLSLIKSENADMVLIQGDLGYDENTARDWDANLSNILGVNFPVLTVAGNHENFEWPLYQQVIRQRISRSNVFDCTGEIGVKSSCHYGDLHIVQVAPAIYEVDEIKAHDGYPEYIRQSFANSDATWRICSWHKNQSAMQVATKGNSVGWDVYNACLEAGAMVVNGHAHTYSRTHLLSDFSSQKVVHTSSHMELKPGVSFAAVSGLGGRNIKSQSNYGDWFASIYTASQNATHGALFCDFDNRDASCYFKAIDGSVPDQFTLSSAFSDSDRAQSTPDKVTQPPAIDAGSDDDDLDIDLSNIVAGVFSRTDKSELRWIAPDRSGQWGNIWIDRECAESLGGTSYRGDWATLIALAPAWDAIPNPCTDGTAPSGPTQSEPTQSAPDQSPSTNSGFVFSRTDKQELRWIDTNSSGALGSVWIDQNCAQQLGGVQATGDWNGLLALAPATDSISNPCTSQSRSDTSNQGNDVGYVFARTDKNEYRWIDTDSRGRVSSVWIDAKCVASLGGVRQRGDWSDLQAAAPAFDTIENPGC